MDKIRQSFVKIAAVLCVVGLLFALGDLSVPPANIPIFICVACLGFVALALGSRRYQIFGITIVAGALMLALLEHSAALRIQKEHKMAQQYSATNIEPGAAR